MSSIISGELSFSGKSNERPRLLSERWECESCIYCMSLIIQHSRQGKTTEMVKKKRGGAGVSRFI